MSQLRESAPVCYTTYKINRRWDRDRSAWHFFGDIKCGSRWLNRVDGWDSDQAWFRLQVNEMQIARREGCRVVLETEAQERKRLSSLSLRGNSHLLTETPQTRSLSPSPP